MSGENPDAQRGDIASTTNLGGCFPRQALPSQFYLSTRRGSLPRPFLPYEARSWPYAFAPQLADLLSVRERFVTPERAQV
jgi:hypothetical protein